MSVIQQRQEYQRISSIPPEDLPEDAHMLYKTEEQGCCPDFSSCINSSEDSTDAIHSEVLEEESDILVNDPDTQRHSLQAKLSTFKVRDGDECPPYKRHILTSVIADGTVSEMQLKDDDEIVLLNEDMFVPEISHKEMLETFLKIKVDGRSPFKMVIRRKKVTGCFGGSGWTWVELSTTFSLEREIEEPIKAVTQSKLLKKNTFEMLCRSLNLYKVEGTQLYITINNGQVYTDTLAGDDSDMTQRLYKHFRIGQGRRNEDFLFAVSLSDHTQSWFITDDRKGSIVLREQEPLLL